MSIVVKTTKFCVHEIKWFHMYVLNHWVFSRSRDTRVFLEKEDRTSISVKGRRASEVVNLVVCLKVAYRQNPWNDVRCPTMRLFTLRHNVQRYLGQSEDWIFWVSLVRRTCNVWRNELSAIVSGIGGHFKFCRYVNWWPVLLRKKLCKANVGNVYTPSMQ